MTHVARLLKFLSVILFVSSCTLIAKLCGALLACQAKYALEIYKYVFHSHTPIGLKLIASQ